MGREPTSRSRAPRLRRRAASGQGRFGSRAPIGYRAPPKRPTMLLPFLLLLQDGALQGGTAAPAPSAAAPSLLTGPLFPLLLVGALFFFLLILPERKKQKQRQKMLDALKKGDRVMTSSGIYGTVVTTTAEVAVLQVADNVRLRFSRSAIQSVIEAEKEAALEEKAEPSKV